MQLDRHQKSSKKVKTKKKKKKSIVAKVFLVIFIVLLILAVGTGAVAYKGYKYFDNKVSTMDRVSTKIEDFAIDPTVKKDLERYRNIALLGVDARMDEDKETTRTDAIIIVTVDTETGDIKLTSVMRDSYLQMQDANNEDILDKVTHANVYGGPVNTCRALNRSLDLNISEFVVLDWKTVADTVDALGGITVEVHENEIYDLNHWGPETAVNTGRDKYKPIKKVGKQKIDGVQAATYCRIRKSSGGDPGRTDRMRKVVLATVDKMTKNPKLIMKLADDVFPSITTNINTKQLLTLIPVALDFEMKDNYVYPFDYSGVKLGEVPVWYAVPTTLEENCILLHDILFKDKNYEPTKQCKDLSKITEDDTQIHFGNEMNSTGDKKRDQKLYNDIFQAEALNQEQNQPAQ